MMTEAKPHLLHTIWTLQAKFLNTRLYGTCNLPGSGFPYQ